MKHFLVAMTVICSTAVTFTSCTKDPLKHMSVEDSRVYITQKDSSAIFSAYSTFYIQDSVAVINGDKSIKELKPIDSAYIKATAKYLIAVGYTQTTDSSKADMGIVINRVISYSTGYYDYGSYWGGYGGFWDPGYYWGYSGYGYGYPGYLQSFVIKDVSIEIDLFDLKNATANKKIALIWMGAINGAGVASNNNPTVADGQVANLFAQSTYLKK